MQTSIRRPFLVTLLAMAVLSIAGWNLLRLALVFGQWQFLTGYKELSPLYLVLSGLFWFLVGIWTSVSLWLGKPWAARMARLFSLGYVLYLWVDRLFLRRSPIQENWFFPLLLTLLGMAFTFWATRPRSHPLLPT